MKSLHNLRKPSPCGHKTCPPDGCRRPKAKKPLRRPKISPKPASPPSGNRSNKGKEGGRKNAPKQSNQSIYKKEARAFRKERPLCECRVPGICTRASEGVHHVRGRVGDLLLDKAFWLSSCNACNRWIEINSKQAMEMGLKQTKYSPNYKRTK